MMRRKRKSNIPRPEASCLGCANCIPIGEGDHICNECGEPVIVFSGYVPAEDYLKCGGNRYEKN